MRAKQLGAANTCMLAAHADCCFSVLTRLQLQRLAGVDADVELKARTSSEPHPTQRTAATTTGYSLGPIGGRALEREVSTVQARGSIRQIRTTMAGSTCEDMDELPRPRPGPGGMGHGINVLQHSPEK
jgi:hypothetical protein